MPSVLRPPAAPAGTSPAGTLIISCTVLLLTGVSLSTTVGPGSLLAGAVLVSAALIFRDLPALHLSLFTFPCIALPALLPQLRTWPAALLVPFLLYLGIALLFPDLRRTLFRPAVGNWSRQTLARTLLLSGASAIGLCLWYAVERPDLSVHQGHVPALPGWLLPLAGLGFSLGNAALEEAVFRGVIMQSMDDAWGPGLLANLGQAWLFGMVHFQQGFPNGAAGVALAMIYGFLLGSLRRSSRGMAAPWTAHVMADIVIFVIVVFAGSLFG